MKSVMKHTFSQIPKAEIERSSFDRSHGYKSTFDAGVLIPFYVDEAVPGDQFSLNMTCLARIATLINPPMDNIFLETFFFSVPYRLVWSNWEKMHGEQGSPSDPTDFSVPQMTSPATTGYVTGSLQDYMGLPVGVPGVSHSALPLRAYNLIYQNWFKDQNLIVSPYIDKGDGPDSPANYVLRRRAKRADYFTSALPWPQKGNSVLVPLGAYAPVITTGENIVLQGNTDLTDTFMDVMPTSGNIVFDTPPTVESRVRFGSTTGLRADLSAATAASVNAWREAFQLQRLLERDARGGTRYPEIIKAHYGVQDPQFDVLQRPQYLGGGSTPLHVHTVPQTSGTPGTGGYTPTPQGNLAAFGTVQAYNHGFTKAFTEHCIIMGILCVRADLTYQQGLERMWSRKTRFEHYYPALSHLGEQPVLNKEIYAQGTSVDEEIFGYQERWAEMRQKLSLITGKFRSNETGGTPLDSWHLSQDFASLPTLSQQFIEEDPPIDRIIAVQDEPQFLFDAYIKLTCARPMPVYSVPGMIDHF